METNEYQPKDDDKNAILRKFRTIIIEQFNKYTPKIEVAIRSEVNKLNRAVTQINDFSMLEVELNIFRQSLYEVIVQVLAQAQSSIFEEENALSVEISNSQLLVASAQQQIFDIRSTSFKQQIFQLQKDIDLYKQRIDQLQKTYIDRADPLPPQLTEVITSLLYLQRSREEDINTYDQLINKIDSIPKVGLEDKSHVLIARKNSYNSFISKYKAEIQIINAILFNIRSQISLENRESLLVQNLRGQIDSLKQSFPGIKLKRDKNNSDSNIKFHRNVYMERPSSKRNEYLSPINDRTYSSPLQYRGKQKNPTPEDKICLSEDRWDHINRTNNVLNSLPQTFTTQLECGDDMQFQSARKFGENHITSRHQVNLSLPQVGNAQNITNHE